MRDDSGLIAIGLAALAQTGLFLLPASPRIRGWGCMLLCAVALGLMIAPVRIRAPISEPLATSLGFVCAIALLVLAAVQAAGVEAPAGRWWRNRRGK